MIKDIASFLDADYSGSPNISVKGINEIHKVEHGDLTFVDHPKYYKKALQSKASAIIINQRMDAPKGKSLIFSEKPFDDYVKLVNYYHQFEPSYKMISDTAKIGEGTIIQPGVFIGHHVEIGKNCRIHANVSISDQSILGDNVIIHSNTVIGSDAFYYKKQNHAYTRLESCGRVILKDNVEIGSNCSIDRGVSGETIIGTGTKLDNLIQIGHDTIIGKNCLIAAQAGIAGAVTIENDVTLWGQVGVHKDLSIGQGAVVLGQSGVTKSLKGNNIYFGTPAIDAQQKRREIAMLRDLPALIERLTKS